MTVLGRFLTLLMRRLLFDNISRGTVESCGTALLPMIMAEPATFQRMGAPHGTIAVQTFSIEQMPSTRRASRASSTSRLKVVLT